MNYNTGKFRLYVFCGILLIFISLASLLLPILMPELIDWERWHDLTLIGGIVAAFLGILFLLAAVGQVYKARIEAEEQEKEYHAARAHAKKAKKKKRRYVEDEAEEYEEYQEYQEAKPQVAHPQPTRRAEPKPVSEGNMQYFPSDQAYKVINMGSKQPIDEKFSEIAKMERAQFVVYVAKLFSLKGYTVKYTPVIDNYNIDLIVEKMGVVIAVGCILTSKVLGESDIRPVAEGRSRYQTTNVTVLTNMYFDRTALNYAKQEDMSLIDHNILAEDFMK